MVKYSFEIDDFRKTFRRKFENKKKDETTRDDFIEPRGMWWLCRYKY